MKAELRHVKNYQFVGVTDGGHAVNFDAYPPVGGEATAGTPMEVLLLCLASCTAMDVVAILGKKKQKFDSFGMKAEAEKSEGHPKVFTKIHLTYIFTGEEVKEKDVARAIELSMIKQGGVEVTYGHEIVGAE